MHTRPNKSPHAVSAYVHYHSLRVGPEAPSRHCLNLTNIYVNPALPESVMGRPVFVT
jgi:hypothetical protein